MSAERQAIFVRPWLGLSGADRWAVEAALALQAAGWRVEIWVNEHNREASFPETLDGRLAVHVAAARRAPWLDRFRLWRVCLRQRRLLRAIRAAGRRPDLLICDMVTPVVPEARRWFPEARVLIYCHYPDVLLGRPVNFLHAWYRRVFARREARGMLAAHRVVVNSAFTAAAVRRAFPEWGGRELPVVYPGVPLPEAPVGPAQAGGKTFLVVSRFDPRKGLPLALAAFGAMRARLPAEEFAGCRLVFAGGFDRNLPEAHAIIATLRTGAAAAGLAGQVELRFDVSPADLERLWAGALAVVHPTEEEHFGIVPVEAMGWGRPVLAVDDGGPRETVVEGVTGALRAPRAEDFAEVMAEWVREPERAAALGAAGRTRALEHFGRGTFARQFLAAAEAATRPHVAVLHPDFRPRGGGEQVAAWCLQALAEDHELTLVTLEPVDWAAVDRQFGTHLAGAGIVVVRPPRLLRGLARKWPGEGYLLRRALIEREAGRLARRARVDHWLSTCNEMRLPRPGWQYVHLPTAGVGSLGGSGLAGRAHAVVCRWVGGSGLAVARENTTWVNSQFTADAWKRRHGTVAAVLHPPVPSTGPGRPWAHRVDRVVCVGRLCFGKGIGQVVEIVTAIRARGVALRLVLAGTWDCAAAERRVIERLAMKHGWIEIRAGLERSELVELLGESRYGLHGMEDEPFGIAVAEMQGSGMIVLAPASGGPVEILGDARLLYRDRGEAVEKFLGVWHDPAGQAELHAVALGRAGRYAPERFMAAVRAGIAPSVAGQGPGRSPAVRKD